MVRNKTNSFQQIGDVATYVKTKRQDYPSVGQMKETFDKFKTQTIFAVTENVVDLYKVKVFARKIFVIECPNPFKKYTGEHAYSTRWCNKVEEKG